MNTIILENPVWNPLNDPPPSQALKELKYQYCRIQYIYFWKGHIWDIISSKPIMLRCVKFTNQYETVMILSYYSI